MSGRVCEKHNEYAADGVCRWCEKPKPATAAKETAYVIAEAAAWDAMYPHVMQASEAFEDVDF